jgi:hypothetical protein
VILCSVSVQIVEFIRLAGGDAKICEYNQARAARTRRRGDAHARALPVRRRPAASTPSTARSR